MSLWFLSLDLELEILVMEFCSSGVWVWDSILGFVVWCLVFGKLEFGILILEFCAWD